MLSVKDTYGELLNFPMLRSFVYINIIEGLYINKIYLSSPADISTPELYIEQEYNTRF